MNFPEFVADFFEEGLFVVAADADVDFALRVVFDNFGAGVGVGEDDAIFPYDVVLFDEFAGFYNEAGEDAFGHEVVGVAEDEVVGGVPGVAGFADWEELRGNVLVRVVGDLVGEFEADHELEEFVA